MRRAKELMRYESVSIAEETVPRTPAPRFQHIGSMGPWGGDGRAGPVSTQSVAHQLQYGGELARTACTAVPR